MFIIVVDNGINNDQLIINLGKRGVQGYKFRLAETRVFISFIVKQRCDSFFVVRDGACARSLVERVTTDDARHLAVHLV